MKRIIAVVFILLAIAGIVGLNCNAPKTESMLTGRDVVGTLYAVDDSSTLTTWHTLVDVNGPGVLRRVMFRNLSASYDCSLKVYINGNLLATLTEASAEEQTRYVILNNIPSAIGTDTYLAAVDSLGVIDSGGKELNIPFTGSMKIQYKTENASGRAIASAIYERYN